ncbi:hypothetical protein AAVH_37872 [Aphelenchoides avenae]|nr:hypothetical protein AAVH_37872 [Aphelenchus avenae]
MTEEATPLAGTSSSNAGLGSSSSTAAAPSLATVMPESTSTPKIEVRGASAAAAENGISPIPSSSLSAMRHSVKPFDDIPTASSSTSDPFASPRRRVQFSEQSRPVVEEAEQLLAMGPSGVRGLFHQRSASLLRSRDRSESPETSALMRSR